MTLQHIPLSRKDLDDALNPIVSELRSLNSKVGQLETRFDGLETKVDGLKQDLSDLLKWSGARPVSANI